jgi:hypothetical protein
MHRYIYGIATLIFLGMVLAKFDPSSGFTALIRFGETWQEKRLSSLQNLPIATVPRSNGYDGQFYAQIALDPLLLNHELENAIDAPAYRTRRIFAPAVAAVLGAGRPWWTLQAYALLNVVSWLGLGWLLYRWIGHSDAQCFARWAGCMFSIGVLDSVRQSLVDLPALFLIAAAIDLSRTNPHSRVSTLWLALSNLTKETSLIATLAIHSPGFLDAPERRRAAYRMALASLPLALWWLYVDHRFGALNANEGLGNFTWPFLGAFGLAKVCLHEILQGNIDGRYSFGILALLGFSVQAFALWRSREYGNPWWRVGAAYSLLVPFLSLWVWFGYWAACRAVLPLTIGFNLLLPSNRAFWPLWIVGNITILHAVWRFL